MPRTASSVAEVVASGLCIGCGLCAALTKGRVQMKMTGYGGLRPAPLDGFQPNEEKLILSACPGTVAMSGGEPAGEIDDIWGAFRALRHAWATDPEVRFRSATGGALTALGVHLLESGRASFVLHTAADPERPMRSKWVFSETPADVLDHAGSRYGPTAPLAGINAALELGQPFAFIGKPCDAGALHALSKTDPRVDEFCVARLVMVCGGQSRLGKSQRLLDEFGLSEDELTLFRYRGHGNPGLTTVETMDGRSYHKTYQELWEDEGTWELETRCKVCPDALGEAADIAAADVWPGGGPTGEDEGFNGIIVRSTYGEDLVRSAAEVGHLTLGGPITPREFDAFQPHQVRKKHAVGARLEGFEQAGLPTISTFGLRTDDLGQNLSAEDRARQTQGARHRIENGKVREAI